MFAKNKSLFLYLLLLTVFFALVEISFFIQCNASYFNDLRIASDNFDIPLAVFPSILYFLFAQLFVHISFCLLIWLITIANANTFKLNQQHTFYLGLCLWSLGLITILVANCYFFPNSKFAELVSLVLINPQITKISLIIFCSMSLLAVAVIPRLVIAVIPRPKTAVIPRLVRGIHPALWLTASFCALLTITIIWRTPIHPLDAATPDHPNIIIIGIDSLRPDSLSFFGSDTSTPFLDAFLQKATVFSEALTPLARTYPSWSAILTGLYPRQSNIRFNLPKQNATNLDYAMPFIFKKNNYQTIYATDETRFSNIDQQFGFEKIITPPMGLNDFLLGTLNDFPISNLLINTPIGKWLFPYSYANRPVYFTYQPDSFLNLLKPVLSENRYKPVFFAIHFCLPHHPYLWADLSGQNIDGVGRYQASIQRVDQQLRDFFALLEQYQFLQHAVVVVLSDHGEALDLSGDRITENDLFLSQQPTPRFYPSSSAEEKVNQSVGHGTDVLGLSQYHSLLAFRLYGLKGQAPGVRAGRVSLLDIKPTVLSLTGLKAKQISGLPLDLKKPHDTKSLRHLFLESDFSPAAIRTVYPDTHQVLLEGIGLFEVNAKTMRLQVKDEMRNKIINSKQYADIYGEWALALYPQQQGVYTSVLVNLRTGLWTNDLSSKFALQSPAASMLLALKGFYATELSTQV